MPLMGPKATFNSDTSSVRLFPINPGYQGSSAAPVSTGAPELDTTTYYDSGCTWQSRQTPWDQWNTTGW
jgi:hypothetical protein